MYVGDQLMQCVTDIEGVDWFLDLNLGNAERLDAFTQENYSIDLFDAVATMGLLSRPVNVVSFASCLLADQREKLGLTPEQFGRRWKGEHAYRLQRALWQEYRDFFPDLQIQELLDLTLKQLNDLSESEAIIVKKALTKLSEVMTEAVADLQSTIDEGLSS